MTKWVCGNGCRMVRIFARCGCGRTGAARRKSRAAAAVWERRLGMRYRRTVLVAAALVRRHVKTPPVRRATPRREASLDRRRRAPRSYRSCWRSRATRSRTWGAWWARARFRNGDRLRHLGQIRADAQLARVPAGARSCGTGNDGAPTRNARPGRPTDRRRADAGLDRLAKQQEGSLTPRAPSPVPRQPAC